MAQRASVFQTVTTRKSRVRSATQRAHTPFLVPAMQTGFQLGLFLSNKISCTRKRRHM